MKLLSYAATRPGLQAFGSWSVRVGINSPFSHTELLFEEGDGVDEFLPDGSAAYAEGTYWVAGATAADILPDYSLRRAGRKGGIRFKRIKVDPDHWVSQHLPKELFDPIKAIMWFKENEGKAYDWRHIASFVGFIPNLIFSHSQEKFTCSEAAAAALGFGDADRFQPHTLPLVINRMIGESAMNWKATVALANDLVEKDLKGR